MLTVIIILLEIGITTCKRGTGPIFILEPPPNVNFMNTQGVVIDCLVHGEPEPEVSWLYSNNLKLESDKRIEILPNNSIKFHKFSGQNYRQEVHASEYICRAENQYGIVVSRPSHVAAVVDQKYSTQVYDEYVVAGNIAVLKCNLPSYMRDYVQVESWLMDDSTIVSQIDSSRGDKYHMSPNGHLYIVGVGLEDSNHIYKCKTVHLVNKNIVTSENGGTIHVKMPSSGMPPRITDIVQEVSIRTGETAYIPCVAQGSPPPTYNWCKISPDKTCRVIAEQKINNFILKISEKADAGIYRCTASNDMGQETSTTKVTAFSPISAFIHPQSQAVDIGQQVHFECILSGGPISFIKWFKDGNIIVHSANVESHKDLRIEHVNQTSSGMYQCFVGNKFETKQTSSQLFLTALPPEITFTFKTITSNPGDSVLLKCSAKGDPKPVIKWRLRGVTLRSNENIEITNRNFNGVIESELKISKVKIQDSGMYTCFAQNSIGSTDYSNFLRVYGLPVVWKLKTLTVIDGDDANMNCYISGYPIYDIDWLKNGKKIYNSSKHIIFENGTLLIKAVSKVSDNGVYQCKAYNKDGFTSSNTGKINVIVKPEINKNLQEEVFSERVRFDLMCRVIKGDPPIKFNWLLNRRKIPHNLKLITTDSAYMSIISTADISWKHSGNYTCIVKNAAGSDSHTILVKVKSPPRWRKEPKLSSFSWNKPVSLDCAGEGYPPPIVTWRKKSDKMKLIGGKELLKEHHVLENGTLLINSLKKKNINEIFICTISNGIQPDLVKEIQIHTQENSIHFENLPNSFMIKSMEPVEILCKAHGRGSLSVAWYNGTNRLTSKQKRIQIMDNLISGGITSKLKIKHTQGYDTGLYVCKVRNEDGVNSTRIYIQVSGVSKIHNEKEENIIAKNELEDEYGNRRNENEIDGKFKFSSAALLYIIPTSTAGIVLFVILITVCVLLIGQRRKNEALNDVRRNSALRMSHDYGYRTTTLPKVNSHYYESGSIFQSSDDHMYAQMSTYPRVKEIQQFSTINPSSSNLRNYVKETDVS